MILVAQFRTRERGPRVIAAVLVSFLSVYGIMMVKILPFRSLRISPTFSRRMGCIVDESGTKLPPSSNGNSDWIWQRDIRSDLSSGCIGIGERLCTPTATQ